MCKEHFHVSLSSSASLLNSEPLSLEKFFSTFLNSLCRALLTLSAFSLDKKRIYVYLLFLSTNVIMQALFFPFSAQQRIEGHTACDRYASVFFFCIGCEQYQQYRRFLRRMRNSSVLQSSF